jgi:hypothetical protein
VLRFVEPAASSKTANLAGDRYRGPGGCRVQHEAPTVGDRRRHDDRGGRPVEGEVTPEAIVSNRRSSASAGESTIVEGLQPP